MIYDWKYIKNEWKCFITDKNTYYGFVLGLIFTTILILIGVR